MNPDDLQKRIKEIEQKLAQAFAYGDSMPISLRIKPEALPLYSTIEADMVFLLDQLQKYKRAVELAKNKIEGLMACSCVYGRKHCCAHGTIDQIDKILSENK